MLNINDKNLNPNWLINANVHYGSYGVGRVVKVLGCESDGDQKVRVKIKNTFIEESANKLDNYCQLVQKKECLFNKYVSC